MAYSTFSTGGRGRGIMAQWNSSSVGINVASFENGRETNHHAAGRGAVLFGGKRYHQPMVGNGRGSVLPRAPVTSRNEPSLSSFGRVWNGKCPLANCEGPPLAVGGMGSLSITDRGNSGELLSEMSGGLPTTTKDHASGDGQRSVETSNNQTTTSKSGSSWADFNAMMLRAEDEKWRGLPAVRKRFYQEHPQISQMSDGEATEYRLLRNNISVVDLDGNRMPMKPVKTFEHAFSSFPEVLREINRQNFIEPSPIQSQVWPIALSGHDVIGIAQTGTGKTLAFLLPIFIHLDNQPLPRNERNGPGCIIMSPTRELAMQIHTEVMKYQYKGIKSVCIYGGGSRREQVNVCTAGVDIVIATPGRLNDLVRANVINLKSVTFLVLDEADRMLDLGFEPQIKKVLQDIRPDRHTIMTSATWPDLVRELGQRYTRDAFMVFVGSLDLTAARSVTQHVTVIDEEEKMDYLLNFLNSLKRNDKAIVFVGKKNLADHLSSDLICKGLECQSLHGDRDQGDREQALRDITRGRVKILVATDLASRGLDIPDVTHVFNYDFPRNIEEYVHRVGRTGRAGRTGASITLLTRTDWRHSTELVKILEQSGQDVPYRLRQMSERLQAKKAEGGYRSGRRPIQQNDDDGFGGYIPSSFLTKH